MSERVVYFVCMYRKAKVCMYYVLQPASQSALHLCMWVCGCILGLKRMKEIDKIREEARAKGVVFCFCEDGHVVGECICV